MRTHIAYHAPVSHTPQCSIIAHTQCLPHPHALAGCILPVHTPKLTRKLAEPSRPGRQHPAGTLAKADAEAVALAVRAQAYGVAVAQERALQARRQRDGPRAVARGLQKAPSATRLLRTAYVTSCSGDRLGIPFAMKSWTDMYTCDADQPAWRKAARRCAAVAWVRRCAHEHITSVKRRSGLQGSVRRTGRMQAPSRSPGRMLPH